MAKEEKNSNQENELVKAWSDFIAHRENAMDEVLEILNDFGENEAENYKQKIMICGTLAIFGVCAAVLGYHLWSS